jgi:hypothetical protein
MVLLNVAAQSSIQDLPILLAKSEAEQELGFVVDLSRDQKVAGDLGRLDCTILKPRNLSHE